MQATGPEDGNYFKTGLAYAEFLKQKGIDPRVRETAGSLENFNLLTNATDATRFVNAGARRS